ncbi:Hypothetical predicted protein [Lecanosticta acicola]|uniref:Uncharacterized protein n=1 Tax=Lecanosticta acicola TaxID=111012 RepID=A0AAI9EE89_9PEZI|nr:Hypothetical predicted protein [Lecanosticta acicola]
MPPPKPPKRSEVDVPDRLKGLKVLSVTNPSRPFELTTLQYGVEQWTPVDLISGRDARGKFFTLTYSADEDRILSQYCTLHYLGVLDTEEGGSSVTLPSAQDVLLMARNINHRTGNALLDFALADRLLRWFFGVYAKENVLEAKLGSASKKKIVDEVWEILAEEGQGTVAAPGAGTGHDEDTQQTADSKLTSLGAAGPASFSSGPQSLVGAGNSESTTGGTQQVTAPQPSFNFSSLGGSAGDDGSTGGNQQGGANLTALGGFVAGAWSPSSIQPPPTPVTMAQDQTFNAANHNHIPFAPPPTTPRPGQAGCNDNITPAPPEAPRLMPGSFTINSTPDSSPLAERSGGKKLADLSHNPDLAPYAKLTTAVASRFGVSALRQSLYDAHLANQTSDQLAGRAALEKMQGSLCEAIEVGEKKMAERKAKTEEVLREYKQIRDERMGFD